MKQIGHRACKKDMMGRLYGIYAFTNTYHAHFMLHFAVARTKGYLSNT